MAPPRMQIDVALGPARPQPREPEAPLHVLVLADLAGSRRGALADRKPLRVDIDSFDDLFTRLVPSASIEIDGQPCALAWRSMDDFHPDALWASLPLFCALRELRAELDDPHSLPRVAAALGLAPTAAHAAQAPAGAVPDAATAADVQRLLGRPLSAPTAADSAATPAAAAPAAALLQGWLHERIAPFVQPDVGPTQRTLRAAIDATASVLMRAVLHHPRVQAVEAAWRGVERLVRDLEIGESLQLHVLDVARDEIEADLEQHRSDLAASALHRLLCGGGPRGERWGLWALDLAFAADAPSVQTLAALGALAGRAGAPLLAAATPQAAGCASVAHLAEPARWLPADAPERALWAALRASPMAPWIGLALPRVLLRLPYGASTDPVSAFGFEEMPTPREHEAYLWGHASLALTLLAGQAFAQNGWALDLDLHRELEDLPSHVVSEDGQALQQPAAELVLSEQAAQALIERGLMPLICRRDRPAASLLRWQSLAEPAAALRGLGA